jgi:MFS family permease
MANLVISLQDKKIWALGMIGFFTYLSLAGFAEMWAIPYFQELNFSKDEAAAITSMVFWGFGVGGPIWGVISDYYDSRYMPLAIGSLLTALVFGIILGYPELSINTFKILAFLLGALSSVEILVFSATNDLSTNADNATKTSIVNMIVMIGGIMMQPLAGKIIDLFANRSITSFQCSLLPILGCFIAAILLSFYMHRITIKK